MAHQHLLPFPIRPMSVKTWEKVEGAGGHTVPSYLSILLNIFMNLLSEVIQGFGESLAVKGTDKCLESTRYKMRANKLRQNPKVYG